jgi:hypothetical protein
MRLIAVGVCEMSKCLWGKSAFGSLSSCTMVALRPVSLPADFSIVYRLLLHSQQLLPSENRRSLHIDFGPALSQAAQSLQSTAN